MSCLIRNVEQFCEPEGGERTKFTLNVLVILGTAPTCMVNRSHAVDGLVPSCYGRFLGIMHRLLDLGSKETPSVSTPAHAVLDSIPQPDANRPHEQSEQQQASDTNEKTGEALTDLTGKIVKCSSHAVAFGAFSDIWQGRYEGALVAIKVPRLHASDVTAIKLVKVSIVDSELL
jgi:hypothetical protein